MPGIAILEDERNIVRALTMQLETLGYTIRGYTDPVVALPELIANPPDVLLLNGRMPGMHGIDVFREFRLHSQAPVIFISARVEKIEVALAAAGTPAEGYVAKPFFISELAELIAQFAKPNC